MRKLLVFCLPILAIFLAAPSADGDVHLKLKGINAKSYGAFLDDFRADLPVESRKVCGITLLLANVTGSNRYRRVHVTNTYENRTITLAIDVINVYVLGYYTPLCNASHFFNDRVANEAKDFVFKDSNQTTLPFDGSYSQLARAGGNRSNLNLGLVDLNNVYIPSLYGYSCHGQKFVLSDVAKALVSFIQTVSEAARFQIIQRAVKNNRPPTPDVKSLENNWGQLSKQVQLASSDGRFENGRNVTLQDQTGQAVNVSNVNSPYVKGNIQLLLNLRNA